MAARMLGRSLVRVGRLRRAHPASAYCFGPNHAPRSHCALRVGLTVADAAPAGGTVGFWRARVLQVGHPTGATPGALRRLAEGARSRRGLDRTPWLAGSMRAWRGRQTASRTEPTLQPAFRRGQARPAPRKAGPTTDLIQLRRYTRGIAGTGVILRVDATISNEADSQ